MDTGKVLTESKTLPNQRKKLRWNKKTLKKLSPDYFFKYKLNFSRHYESNKSRNEVSNNHSKKKCTYKEGITKTKRRANNYRNPKSNKQEQLRANDVSNRFSFLDIEDNYLEINCEDNEVGISNVNMGIKKECISIAQEKKRWTLWL